MSALWSKAGALSALRASVEAIRGWAPATSLPKSALALVVVFVMNVVGVAVLWRTARRTVGPMLRVAEPTPIPQRTPTTRFGMTEAMRREVFRELADAEVNERRRALTLNTWGGHAWSREDDLGYVQRARAREVAGRNRLSLAQVYLVLDEGIRARWPGPDGQPLRGTSEPISLRSE